MIKTPIGIIQNNPCNICKGSNWVGLTSVQPNNRFCQFEKPIYGIRAFIITFRTYVKKHKIKTVLGFVKRYAPAGDGNNNPYKYSSFILENWRGIGFDVSLYDEVFDESWFKLKISDWSDKQLLFYFFVASVCHIETGYKLSPVLFNSAYAMI